MRYLLDTNLISELRRPTGDAGVKAWVSAQDANDLTIASSEPTPSRLRC